MNDSVIKQIAELPKLSYEELKQLWRNLYGKEPPVYSKPYIVKRLAYRIQELRYGGLSESAREKLREILKTHGYDKNGMPADAKKRGRRLYPDMPVKGTRLVREWNGRRYEVIVVPGGFEYEGRKYRSLTSVTKAITGTHWNGRAFFGLRKTETRKG